LHLGRVFLCLSSVYMAMLGAIIVSGLIRYGHLTDLIPDQSLAGLPRALYWYSAYGGFLEISTLLLALLMGVCAALFGIIKSNPIKGLGFLIVAVAITYLSFSFLPHFYYPGGEISPGFYWLTNGLYDFLGAWLLTTILGLILRHRLKDKVFK